MNVTLLSERGHRESAGLMGMPIGSAGAGQRLKEGGGENINNHRKKRKMKQRKKKKRPSFI